MSNVDNQNKPSTRKRVDDRRLDIKKKQKEKKKNIIVKPIHHIRFAQNLKYKPGIRI